MKTLVLLVSIFSFSSVLAQELGPSPTGQWQFTFTNGVSSPLGTFHRKDPNQAIIYYPSDLGREVLGINKSKSGFAKTGYNMDMAFGRKTRSGFLMFVRTGWNVNAQSTKEMLQFLEGFHDGNVTYSADNYSVFYLMSGVGYGLALGKWEIQPKIMGGFASCNYPYYNAHFEHDNFSGKPLDWNLMDNPWHLNGFASGASLSVFRELSHHFSIAFQASYLQSNIHYTYQPYSPNLFNIEDQIRWRVLQTNVGIGFRW